MFADIDYVIHHVNDRDLWKKLWNITFDEDLLTFYLRRTYWYESVATVVGV